MPRDPIVSRKRPTAERLQRFLDEVVDPLARLLWGVLGRNVPVKWQDLRGVVLATFPLFRQGPWGIASLVIFAITLVGFLVVLRLPAQARGDFLGLPLALGVQTAGVALAYALLISEARRAHPLLRFVVGVYAFWYLLLAPVLSLPRLLAITPALVVYALEGLRLRREGRGPLWLLPWALVLARLSPRWVHPYGAGLLVWVAVYFGLGLGWQRRAPQFAPGTERALLFAAMAVTYGIGFLRSPATFAQHLRLLFTALFTLLGLFWMGRGVDLVDGLVGSAGRAAAVARRWLDRPVATAALATFLVTLGVGLTAAYFQMGWVVNHLPPALAFALAEATRRTWVDLWPAAGVILTVTGLATARHVHSPAVRVQVVGEATAAAVVVVLMVRATSQTFAGISKGIEVPQTWWTLLLAAGPVLLRLIKQAGKGFQVSSVALLVAALTSLALSATATRFLVEPKKALEDTTFYPLVGMLVLGFPYLAARMVAGLGEGLPSARLFLIGYLCALPAALVAPKLLDGSLVLASLLWPWALARGARHLPEAMKQRLASGMLVASATVAFYYQPLYLPIPFVPWTGVVLRRLHQVDAPPLASAGQFAIWLAAALAGSLSALKSHWRWVLPPAVTAVATLLLQGVGP